MQRYIFDGNALKLPLPANDHNISHDLEALEGHWRLAGGKPCAAPGGAPPTNCAPAGAPESLQSTLKALP